MNLAEAIRGLGQIDEAKKTIIGRYVYSSNGSINSDLQRIENPVYLMYKKKGVGASVVIEQGAPGIKRFTYIIKKITSDGIELVESK